MLLAKERTERAGCLAPVRLGKQHSLLAPGELAAPSDGEHLRVRARRARGPLSARPTGSLREGPRRRKPVDPFKELFGDEVMCMSYLYSN